MRPRNVFVLGLKDWQRQELESIDHAEDCRFHGLLGYPELIRDHRPFDQLLQRARRALARFDGPIDAIICHWDFPPSCLAPILAREHGLRSPTLEAVLRCEHKYWARLEQRKAVPECVPAFQPLNPFHPQAANRLELDFPVWLKPVKGFASQLGFHVTDHDQLAAALGRIRARIGELGRPFNQALAHAELPAEIAAVDGLHCLAEQIVSGEQVAPEGYVRQGRVRVHGTLDMGRDRAGHSFTYLRYPSDLPGAVQQRMAEVARRLLPAIGFDDGCFNIEFLWDAPREQLWLIEVNPRISQSHSDLFLKVDGMSNHEIAVAVALGREPHLPHGRGRYRRAAKFMFNKYGDARVLRAPCPEDVAALEREVPGSHIEITVEKGQQLSDMPNQDVYRYVVGEAWIGADSEDELQGKFQHLLGRLPFEFSDRRRLDQ